MRIGIHTGKVVAGIIGSKVVRYDIFGEGVLIANKMESNGEPGKVCISKDTKDLLEGEPDICRQYEFEEHNLVKLTSIRKDIQSYIVSPVVEEEESEISMFEESEENSMEESEEEEDDS
eukprot:CAMPEP_0170481748 /NCGR_PEP_ID=MMETSP0208-20121228/2071_1 /TAXON_ID=197538 /ORGANISM="Strombidium inclinatum, Strain S3" /LENGTH=118 /DNA_ID=CAMNT_0010754505 /DNA_START=997 /DNA_END=1353 /DNA_ORIENTATION=-